MYGYGSAITFKDLTDQDIANIEHKVRTQLLNRIKLHEPTESISTVILQHFGRFYSSHPEEFEFLPGEKSLIKKFIKHVNDMIIQNGYKYFETNWVETEHGTKLSTAVKTENHLYAQVLLNHFVAAANKNANRSPQGYRYSKYIKDYATYHRMIMGHLPYQSFQANLQGVLPSIQSVNRYIHKTYTYISEGILRSNELYLYLKERNLPLTISLSEDATRIVGRPQYDRKTNQIANYMK